MPLASMENPTPAQQEKLRVSRGKIMDKVMRKFLVRLETNAAPIRAIEREGALGGIVFQRTEIVDGRVVKLEGSEFEAPSKQVISSIGSIPMPIDGLPMKGELYRWENWDAGELIPGVFGLGNVLTGKGNIKASRRNAQEITPRVVERALGGPRIPPAGIQEIFQLIQARWDAVGYPGGYADWISHHRPEG
jgi:hypothetical protein